VTREADHVIREAGQRRKNRPNLKEVIQGVREVSRRIKGREVSHQMLDQNLMINARTQVLKINPKIKRKIDQKVRVPQSPRIEREKTLKKKEKGVSQVRGKKV
jgi:hypothetical protein